MAHDDKADELEQAGIERVNEQEEVFTGVFYGTKEQARKAIPTGWREVDIRGTMDDGVRIAVAPT